MRVSRSSTLIALILAFIALAAAQTASPWQVGTSYVAGALVTYNGATYKCTQAHTAQIDWSPVAVPALWQAQGGSVPAPPTTERATATPAPPPGSGCAPAWDEGAIYTGGQRVSQDGKDYRAAWWTQGDSPANNHGVGQPWVLIGACGGAAATTSPPPTAPPTTNPPVTSAPTQPPPATATPTKPPATTSAPTLPPSPPSNGTLPKRVLMGYWQNFDNGATCLRLSNVPAAYNLIAASFADSTAVPGEITFKVDSGLSACLGGYTDDMFIADVRVAHSKGQKVVVSVGGQYGLLNVADTFTASRFADSVYVLMQRFGFDGVDIDLENGINPTYMAEALHKLARRVPGVVITLAPQTIDMQNTGSHYFHLALLIKDILTMSNTQYYNSGTIWFYYYYYYYRVLTD